MTGVIIIDGVNVAGCIDFCPENSECCNANNRNIGCEPYDNCYYKQLKRLKQENKELKEICTKICYQSHGYTCRIWELKESKYKSTLEEIKTIAQTAIDKKYTTKNDDYTEGMEIIGHYVMNKINEVLNEN